MTNCNTGNSAVKIQTLPWTTFDAGAGSTFVCPPGAIVRDL